MYIKKYINNILKVEDLSKTLESYVWNDFL